MSHMGAVTVVILWEEELRAAALALQDLLDNPERGDEAERAERFRTALNASHAALYHIHKNPEAPIVVTAAKRAGWAEEQGDEA